MLGFFKLGAQEEREERQPIIFRSRFLYSVRIFLLSFPFLPDLHSQTVISGEKRMKRTLVSF